MRKSEFHRLIREEVRKEKRKSRLLSEATPGTIKLPANIKIVYYDEDVYMIQFTKYGMEPSLKMAAKIEALLRTEFKKIAKKLQASDLGEAKIYVRDGDVVIGIEFTSELYADEVEDIYPDIEQYEG